MPDTGRIAKPWTASYDPALSVRRGERVTLGQNDPENPGWRWVMNAQGLGGRVPEDALQGDVMVEDFDTAELSVQPGQVVEVLQIRLGWCHAALPEGGTGWLPASVLVRK